MENFEWNGKKCLFFCWRNLTGKILKNVKITPLRKRKMENSNEMGKNAKKKFGEKFGRKKMEKRKDYSSDKFLCPKYQKQVHWEMC